jgi:hypothetical protein
MTQNVRRQISSKGGGVEKKEGKEVNKKRKLFS